MTSGRKAEACIAVAGAFESDWMVVALTEYLKKTWKASLVGDPELKEDGRVVVEIADSSEMLGK